MILVSYELECTMIIYKVCNLIANHVYKQNPKLHFNLEKYRNESRELHLKILEHNNNLRSSIKEVIPLASRDVFSCSPDNYVFGMCVYTSKVNFLIELVHEHFGYCYFVLFSVCVCLQNQRNMK